MVERGQDPLLVAGPGVIWGTGFLQADPEGGALGPVRLWD